MPKKDFQKEFDRLTKSKKDANKILYEQSKNNFRKFFLDTYSNIPNWFIKKHLKKWDRSKQICNIYTIISRTCPLSPDILKINPVQWDWLYITQNYPLDIIIQFPNYIQKWDLANRKLTQDFIETNIKLINFNSLSCSKYLTPNLIEKFQTQLDWHNLAIYQNVNNKFVQTYHENFNKNAWIVVLSKIQVDDAFLNTYQNIIPWDAVAQFQQLTTKLINKYLHHFQKTKTNTNALITFQLLNQNIIEKLTARGNLDWNLLIKFQRLTHSFIQKHIPKFNKYNLAQFQKMPKDFIQKYKINTFDNWLYLTNQQKLEIINNCREYQLSKDKKYITAYKAVQDNFESVYKKNLFYKIGETYKAAADPRADECASFGLAAWTKKRALDYHDNGKLLQVKIYVKDIGCISHQHQNKIRARKIKIVKQVSPH